MRSLHYIALITVFLASLAIAFDELANQYSEHYASVTNQLFRRGSNTPNVRGFPYERLRDNSPPRLTRSRSSSLDDSTLGRISSPNPMEESSRRAGRNHIPDRLRAAVDAVASRRGRSAPRSSQRSQSQSPPFSITRRRQGTSRNSAGSSLKPTSETPLLDHPGPSQFRSAMKPESPRKSTGPPSALSALMDKMSISGSVLSASRRSARTVPAPCDSRAHASVETCMPSSYTGNYGFTKTPHQGKVFHGGQPHQWDLKGVSHQIKASAGGESPQDGHVEATASGKFVGVRLDVKEGGKGYVQQFTNERALEKVHYEPTGGLLKVDLKPQTAGERVNVVAGVVGPGYVKAKAWNKEKSPPG